MTITPAKELVRQAKEEIETLSVDEAAARAEADRALFVDIRDPREIARDGQIPGAFRAPRGMLEFWVDPASPYHKPDLATDRTLILYCASSWRSALAAKTLQDMGVKNVAELDGGLTAWKAAGREVAES